ncbi:MAG: hypothetical protein PVH19_01475 [Planctomycetia bacterium]|jgi:hypothetical protein
MDPFDYANLIFCVFMLPPVIFLGRVIRWKWRHEKRFESSTVDGQTCLWVRGIPAEMRRPVIRFGMFVFMPLLVVFLIVTILYDTQSDFFATFIIGWIWLVEIFVFCAQVMSLGLIVSIGPEGFCYPGTKFRLFSLKTDTQDYPKLASMNVAMVQPKNVRAPWHSVLDWEWFDDRGELVLRLEARGFLKPGPKSVAFVFLNLSDSERSAIQAMFREKTGIVKQRVNKKRKSRQG